MSKVAIVTDSNSGITQKMAKELGVYVLPMSFLINGKVVREDIDITQAEFFKELEDPNVSVSTSQPAPAEVTDLWDRVLRENDEIVYIPLSSGLSNSYQTARLLAENYDGKVQVVNNQRISVTMRQSVEDAQTLRDAGWNAEQIREKLEEDKFNSSIYIMVDTLKYLKRGGRITAAAALIGSVLHIKPVLQIQGEKLDAYAKARGTKQAKKIMLDAVRKDMTGRFKDFVDKGEYTIRYSYSEGDDPEEVKEWVDEIKAAFPNDEIKGDPLSLVIGCHIGPGSLAVTINHKITV
ncbi:DegV family protein [Bilifractor sp. LCP19S3_H10]|uniref:DegV family protein n=1 Tax=Bilifractor sp. LCP19S3_H10 TaxID=3438736 RepID=UPI003F0AE451